ncbi:penicillin-binding protein [Flavobacterium columnare]|uniref:serine hydrolase domain-containing protein n=1 Tax=Flavobacterium columnare TaxID=996 RepID=UPI00098216A4|nr:serine hydrolase domain-containing protein [Flavobacterium columnare]MBF6651401.1 penicillin-binding protein [Flavobacterium columnare]MBF6655242.1 penicillin-binding protein [Flavobacterium columnare]MBF6659341.1 penicillin-binding protein [Flavobacterium columnare]OOB82766.1 penicillin-binding protein [Flavobacterium columnare]PTD14692.1 penicillin-binding protein [Flavobacterium columnare]
MKLVRVLVHSIVVLFVLSACTDKKAKVKAKEEYKIGKIYTMKPYQEELPVIDSKELKKVQDSMDYLYNKEFFSNDFSGGILVAKNGKILYEKYSGMGNFEKDVPITAHTPLHIASVSKVLTATAILLLIDSNMLKLDEKVKTILDGFPYEDITVRMLLNHRSGLRNYSYFIEDKGVWERGKVLHNSDLISVMKNGNIGLEFKPDARFSYCNTNYALLALIIEKISKMNYRTAMSKMIFEPLGMKNTYVFDLNEHADTASCSYKGNYIKYPLNHLDDIYGDKNIYSTPRDLLKFDMATYNSDFLNKKLLAEVYKGYSYEARGVRNYGLGIRLLEWKDGKQMFYHNGWWHGNTSAYITLKKEKVTLIALSNKYTRKAYYMKLATGLFGDYPFHIHKKGDELVE